MVSILGGLSAVLILSDMDNVQVNTDEVTFNLEINNVTRRIENINFTLPFNLTNTGYFDLENLQLGAEVSLNYTHINWTSPGVNLSRIVKIFETTQKFEDIPSGDSKNFTFYGYNNSFLFQNYPDPLTEIDWTEGPPALIFYANFTLSLDYSLGLHSLSITILNIKIGDYTPS
ncbi:MAG: hypothetical protein ACFFG0_46565 [Candidatus Thorarchaeota archaeon]